MATVGLILQFTKMQISGHVGQEIHIYGGAGGNASSGGIDGQDGDAVIGTVLGGAYNVSI